MPIPQHHKLLAEEPSYYTVLVPALFVKFFFFFFCGLRPFSYLCIRYFVLLYFLYYTVEFLGRYSSFSKSCFLDNFGRTSGTFSLKNSSQLIFCTEPHSWALGRDNNVSNIYCHSTPNSIFYTESSRLFFLCMSQKPSYLVKVIAFSILHG